jgi:hypothetical protein
MVSATISLKKEGLLGVLLQSLHVDEARRDHD